MQTRDSYLRVQAIISALINMVVNPVITWLLNRGMQPVTLPSILIDMAITCLIMSTAIALFVIPGARRAITTGSLAVDDKASGSCHRGEHSGATGPERLYFSIPHEEHSDEVGSVECRGEFAP